MRICYVGNLSSVHTQRWTRYFAEAGHDVHIISTSRSDDPGQKGDQIYPMRLPGQGRLALPLTIARMPLTVRHLRRLIERIAPDVVHVHYINEAAVLTALAGFRPLILTAWGSEIVVAVERSWIRKRAVQYAIKRAALLTCDADHMKERLVELGADPARVEIVRFGVDVLKYCPERCAAEVRARVAPGAKQIVISIRSLEPVYDVQTMVRAVPMIRDRYPEVSVLIGGGGSQAGMLQELANNLGVARSVRFLGALSQDVLPGYLASSDVYVSNALSDGGLAASTQEAMAAGVPVVISDVMDNGLWVAQGVSGYLVPPSDPEPLARRIIELLADAGLRARMGAAGRQYVVDHASMQGAMSGMEALYQKVVAEGRGPCV